MKVLSETFYLYIIRIILTESKINLIISIINTEQIMGRISWLKLELFYQAAAYMMVLKFKKLS